MSSNGSAPTTTAPAALDATTAPDHHRLGWRSGRQHPPAPPPIAPPRTRRRPGLLAAGVALVAIGALGAARLTQVVADTDPVVAVARDVQPGQVIDRADLTVAGVAADPALRPVPADRLPELIGQRSAVALTAGSLLTETAIIQQVVPTAGQSVVGVALQRAQLPAEPLQPGDRIRVVDTPTSQGDPPASTPQTIPGVVLAAAAPDDNGQTIVDVTVPSAQAADLAARVATGRIALILDTRER